MIITNDQMIAINQITAKYRDIDLFHRLSWTLGPRWSVIGPNSARILFLLNIRTRRIQIFGRTKVGEKSQQDSVWKIRNFTSYEWLFFGRTALSFNRVGRRTVLPKSRQYNMSPNLLKYDNMTNFPNLLKSGRKWV